MAPPESTQIVFGRGSVPDSARGAYGAPQDPLVGWGGDTPSHSPPRLLRPSILPSAF